MAQRLYNQFKGSLEKGVVILYGNISIGASGAPTLATNSAGQNQNYGIKSISRTSAGLYVVTFGDATNGTVDLYSRLLSFDAQILLGSVPANVSSIQVYNDSTSSGTITFQCYGPASSSSTVLTAQDPDNGASLLLEIHLKHYSI